MNTITTPLPTIASVVPRSGCISTIAQGMPIRIAAGAIPRSVPTMAGGRVEKKRARTITIAGFISSEGWSVMNPRSIQRWLPPPVNPIASTTSNRPTSTI